MRINAWKFGKMDIMQNNWPCLENRDNEDAIQYVVLMEEHYPTHILNIQIHLMVHPINERNCLEWSIVDGSSIPSSL